MDGRVTRMRSSRIAGLVSYPLPRWTENSYFSKRFGAEVDDLITLVAIALLRRQMFTPLVTTLTSWRNDKRRRRTRAVG
jgi:hypothetical protein